MNFSIEYDVELSELKDFVRKVKSRITKDNLTNLEVAVRNSGEIMKYEWIKTAESKFKHSQGGYAQGIIDGVEYPFNEDTLHYRIRHTKNYALYLERFCKFRYEKSIRYLIKSQS